MRLRRPKLTFARTVGGVPVAGFDLGMLALFLAEGLATGLRSRFMEAALWTLLAGYQYLALMYKHDRNQWRAISDTWRDSSYMWKGLAEELAERQGIKLDAPKVVDIQ